MENLNKIAQLLSEVKTKKPLVHQITNYVTVNDCANAVLALGGSPVMADAESEVAEMVAIASSLVINIGTLNERTVNAMLLAGQRANELGIPVVLDPVGVGATSYRTKTAERLINDLQLAILRGNISEIKMLAGVSSKTRGVDATEDSQGGLEIAKRLAHELNCTIAITGAQDIISDGLRTGVISNGHPLLAKVTGTGCMATALVGCFAGVSKDYYLAASAGIITMGLAGEKAFAQSAAGIGSFRVGLLDVIYNLGPADLIQGGKFDE